MTRLRSTQRQRTTPSFTGPGPATIIGRSFSFCAFVNFGGRPGERDAHARLRRSAAPNLLFTGIAAPMIAPESIATGEQNHAASCQGIPCAQESGILKSGISHAMLVLVPPIYDDSAGPPGLLLDDCFISADAPSVAMEALLSATEGALVAAGAPRLIASCPAAGPL